MVTKTAQYFSLIGTPVLKLPIFLDKLRHFNTFTNNGHQTKSYTVCFVSHSKNYYILFSVEHEAGLNRFLLYLFTNPKRPKRIFSISLSVPTVNNFPSGKLTSHIWKTAEKFCGSRSWSGPELLGLVGSAYVIKCTVSPDQIGLKEGSS
jgi:hypothetical protein